MLVTNPVPSIYILIINVFDIFLENQCYQWSLSKSINCVMTPVNYLTWELFRILLYVYIHCFCNKWNWKRNMLKLKTQPQIMDLWPGYAVIDLYSEYVIAYFRMDLPFTRRRINVLKSKINYFYDVLLFFFWVNCQ